MKNKNLIIGIIVAVVVAIVVAAAIIFTNNNNKQTSSTNGESKASESNVAQGKEIDNNENYFVIINGEKFKAGDKFSKLSKVNLKQDSRVTSKEVGKNTYMIGAGSIYNENKKVVCNMTPYNSTDSKVTVADSEIGGIKIGEYEYGKIPDYVLSLNVEFCKGLKFGSSLEDIKKIFGEPDSEYNAENLGYTRYTYKSEEIYRKYEFTIDKDGKLSQVNWQNLVANQ